MNEFTVYIDGKSLKIALSENGSASVDEKDHSYELITLNQSEYLLKVDDKIHHIHCSQNPSDNYKVLVDGKPYDIKVRTALQEKAAAMISKMAYKSAGTEIKAPMPGMVLKINKSVSDPVKQGESLLILEATKMENDLSIPRWKG